MTESSIGFLRKRRSIAGFFALAVTSALSTLPASAQSIEAGATVGIGARGGEAEFMRAESRGVGGVRVSARWGDRVETAFRLSWLSLPKFASSATYGPTPVVHVLTERTGARLFATSEALYLFWPGARVRPFVGGGVGAIVERLETTCDVPDCAQALPGLSVGRTTSTYLDPIGTFGVAGTVRRKIVLRGAVAFHRPAGEDLSLVETFFGIGYRF